MAAIRGNAGSLLSEFIKIGVFLTLALITNAQYRIDTWTTNDGLPQNSVTGLTQTRDGYIWFTTNDGLVRFDGARFKVFNKSNPPELTTHRLVAAFEDKSGRLMIKAEDYGSKAKTAALSITRKAVALAASRNFFGSRSTALRQSLRAGRSNARGIRDVQEIQYGRRCRQPEIRRRRWLRRTSSPSCSPTPVTG